MNRRSFLAMLGLAPFSRKVAAAAARTLTSIGLPVPSALDKLTQITREYVDENAKRLVDGVFERPPFIFYRGHAMRAEEYVPFRHFEYEKPADIDFCPCGEFHKTHPTREGAVGWRGHTCRCEKCCGA